MIPKEMLEKFKCALADNYHFLVDPIILSECGHSVCKNCIPTDELDSIKCKICGVTTIEEDFHKIHVSEDLKQNINLYLVNTFELIANQADVKMKQLRHNLEKQGDLLKIRLNHLADEIDMRVLLIIIEVENAAKKLQNTLKELKKGKIKGDGVEIKMLDLSSEESLENKITYIEDEIEIRTESIKIEVQEAAMRLKDKLKETKKETLKLDGDDAEIKLEIFDLTLKELQKSYKTKINLNERYLKKAQDNYKSLNQAIQNLNSSIKYPVIKFSKEKASEDLIGKIYFDNVQDLLKHGEKRVFELDDNPRDLLLAGDQIVLADPIGLKIYDENFNFVKRIQKFAGIRITPSAIQVNSKDKLIYILNVLKPNMLMVDYNFNLIKSVDSNGTANNQSDMCYKNDSLYICDNMSLQIYLKDLEFEKTIKLDYEPLKIKATNSIIGVQTSMGEINFYNVNGFSFIRRYHHGWGRISQINSFLYEINHITKNVYCYDENAILKELIVLKGIDDILTDDDDGAFIDFNGKLLMQSFSLKKIIVFSTKKNQELNRSNKIPEFEVSKEKLNEDFIGEICLVNGVDFFKNGEKHIYNLDAKPCLLL